LLKTPIKLFTNGIIILSFLAITQMVLDYYINPFLLFQPPLGYAFYLALLYFLRPLIVGALNVVLVQQLYHLKGWTISLWLNGLFIMLIFSGINLVLIALAGVNLSLFETVIEVFVLSIPFGKIAKYSN